MSLRATSPFEEAAGAVRDRWMELVASGSASRDWGSAEWREIASAAVLACDHAQPTRPHVPLFTGEELHLRIPAESWLARVVCWWLRFIQQRHGVS